MLGFCYSILLVYRPLRDDEVLPVRKHRVVAGAAATLKGEEPVEKEVRELVIIECEVR